MKHIQRALLIVRKFWPTAAGALISLIIVNLANLAAPQLLRVLIDQGISPGNMNRIWTVAGLLIGLALARGIFNFSQGYWMEVTSQNVAYTLRNAIFEKLQGLSFSYHDKTQTGKMMVRMTSDVEIVRMFAGPGFLQLISAILLLIGTLVILFATNALLTGIFLLMVPVIAVIMVIFIRQVMPLSKVVQKRLGELNTVLQENLAGIRIVKAFAREPYEIDRFKNQNQVFLNENINLVRLFSTNFPLVFLVANLTMTGVLWMGGLQVINQQLTLGELVAFQGYQMFLLMPIFMLGGIGAMLSRAEVSAQRIFEVIDAESEVQDKPGAVPLDNVVGKVTFDNVSFRYAGGEQDVISSVTFSAEPNQKIAIIGQTGSGKSSIINLIPRFYDVREGRVLVDGFDIRDVTIQSLRKNIGIVLQETTLFSGTIRENIAYGDPEATLEAVMDAAKVAQAHEFITSFPEGYETIIGERGVGLSGGQKQRIAIARAVLLDPRILIMDDSTSSVDAETEYHIQKDLERLMEGRTTFVIAQRLSTIRDADKILLMDQGKLVASGTHEELLECCELYAEILASQFRDQEELLPTGNEVQS